MTAVDPASSEWWQRVFDAADRALQLDTDARAAFLQQCSSRDRAFAEQVEELLRSGEAPSPLDTPAAVLAAPLIDGQASPLEPAPADTWFGPYRIVRELGQGGMGAVYLAARSDDQYQKCVALKILPPWNARNDRRVQRFLEERQILAGLDHPGIAGLLDGGITASGVPWFAMEFVEGVPIDRYCEDSHLPIDKRLELFADVCAAVQYAHRNLVVHRDLKPSNILVTAEGRAKLLDFGIAKLLAGGHAAAVLTVANERILTPLYASPEQLRGEPISTASDVYSLGVVLHLLLTGSYPYRLSSWEHHEVARAVLEQEPLRPSVAGHSVRQQRVLRGDLDAIALKALAKEPNCRYASVEQLEADVRRNLGGLPVLARTESRFYYARKFVGRHRLGVAMTAVAAILIMTFATVMTVQRSRIALERDRAEQVAAILTTAFESVDQSSPQRAVTAQEVLDQAAARIDLLHITRPEQRADLMYSMGEAYHRLNFDDQARGPLERSLALRRKLQPKRELEVAQTLHLLGDVLVAQQELEPAGKAYDEALGIRRRVRGAQHHDVARTLVGLSSVRRAQGRLPEAEQLARQAMQIDERRTGDVRLDLAQSTGALAQVLLTQGDAAGAAHQFRRSLVLVREKHREEHVDVANAALGLATALRSAGDQPGADSLLRYGLAVYQRVALASAFTATTQGSTPLTSLASRPMPPGTDPGDEALVVAAASNVSGSDNSLIAFSSDRDGPDPTGNLGNVEIYVMNPDGTGQRRLTHNVGVDDNPTWSPDGRRIAFTRRNGASIDVFVMNADGSEQRQLTDPAQSALGFRRPSWSPDGKRLVVQSRVRPDVFVVNVDGTGLTNITRNAARDQGPSWSPDGRRIAFVSDRGGNDEIYLMDPDGRNLDRLTANAASDGAPKWSPDGRRIAFHSDRDSEQKVYVMNADGSGQRRLTADRGDDSHPTWSPDGERIAFHRRVLGHLQIHIMNADGGNVQRLTELSPVAFSGFPSWGPARR